jgi:hypothetical protein
MLAKFRAALAAYFNSRWAWRIFVVTSIALLIGSFVVFSMLGFGNHNGGSGTAGAQVIMILSLVLAVPAIIVVNALVALLWAAALTIARS